MNGYRKCKKERFGNKLIETYPIDMKDGRVAFERKLEKLFGDRNIKCFKKKGERLWNDAFDQANSRVRNLFLSFIQRCAQKEWSVERVQEKLKDHSGSEIEEVFLEAAIKVYRKYYEQFLALEGESLARYDYSMLLPEATKMIKDDCLLKLKYYDDEGVGGGTNR